MDWTSSLPPSLPSSQQVQSTQIPGLTLVVESMETFDAEMARRAAAEAAADGEGNEKTEENNHNSKASTAFHHRLQQQQQQLKSENSKRFHPYPSAAPPALLPSKRASQWVPKLNHLLQAHGGVRAEFSFNEDLPQLFSCTLTIVITSCDGGAESSQLQSFSTAETKLFGSKKEAKEHVAEQGVLFLQQILDGKSGAKHKASAATTLRDGGEKEEGVDRSENWVGLLNEFCQGNTLPTPLFNDYQHGAADAAFSSTCTLSLPAALSDGEGREKTFGDMTKSFRNKKAAKLMAAREAVLYLRAQGVLKGKGMQPPLDSCSTSMKNSALTTSTSPGPNTTTTTSVDTTPPINTPLPLPQQIAMLCKELGLPLPTYSTRLVEEDATSSSSSAFYTTHALFSTHSSSSSSSSLHHYPASSSSSSSGLDLPPGPIGLVERVYGRKRAKEECDRRVVEVLRGLRERRLQDLQGFFNE